MLTRSKGRKVSEEGLAEVLSRHGIDAPSLELLFSPDGHEVYGLTVPGARALATWGELRDLSEQTGYWPVILGGDEEVKLHREAIEDVRVETSVEEIISRANDVEIDTLWQERYLLSLPIEGPEMEAYASLLSSGHSPGSAEETAAWDRVARRFEGRPEEKRAAIDKHLRGIMGTWPEAAEPHNYFSIPYAWTDDFTRLEPLPSVRVALVPTTAAWEVPAYLKFGGWNDCPAPHEHVAVLKHWHELYGAQLVGLAHDVLELGVTRPPKDRTGALIAALEQYAYCPDLVDQGTESLAALAATLQDASVWYAWWD